MLIDKSLQLADVQSGASSAASTNYIDTLAKGESYRGFWFVVTINTAFAQTGTTARVTFQFQTASDSAFTADTSNLASSSLLTTAQLAAGQRFQMLIPATGNIQRYLRGYKLVSGNDASNLFTAGAWSMFVAKDVPVQFL